jgi:DNA-binding NarL/FixJ family response regulator
MGKLAKHSRKPSKSAKPDTRRKSETGKKEKILLVDDEPGFIEAFRMTLDAKRYEVITASNKPDAQELMRKVEPHIVVLGTITPAGQSFALHQWLKQHPRHKDIPLMVIDAKYEERSIRGWRMFEGMQLEADEYLTKPVEPASLVPRIQSLLAEVVRLIKVLVADDHTMVRDGICAVLALQKDIDVIGEAVNGLDAIEKTVRLMPNVALMDIVMPTLSGLEATKQIGVECPQTKVLILTQYDEKENMLVAKQVGAYGFIPKRAASSDLVTGVRSVYKGKYFPESFAEVAAK